ENAAAHTEAARAAGAPGGMERPTARGDASVVPNEEVVAGILERRGHAGVGAEGGPAVLGVSGVDIILGGVGRAVAGVVPAGGNHPVLVHRERRHEVLAG